MVVVVALGWSGAAVATAPVAHAATADVAVIGSRDAASYGSGYRRFDAGPVAGTPTAQVDTASSTVTVAVDDPTSGATATMTMAWPARPGTWNLAFDGPDPEQTVRLTRGASSCVFTAGTLVVYRAEATPTGQVAALSVDAGGRAP